MATAAERGQRQVGTAIQHFFGRHQAAGSGTHTIAGFEKKRKKEKKTKNLILQTDEDANPPSFPHKLNAYHQAVRLNKQSWMASMKERATTPKQSLPARSTTALSMRWAEQPVALTWLTTLGLSLTSHEFDLTRCEFMTVYVGTTGGGQAICHRTATVGSSLAWSTH